MLRSLTINGIRKAEMNREKKWNIGLCSKKSYQHVRYNCDHMPWKLKMTLNTWAEYGWISSDLLDREEFFHVTKPASIFSALNFLSSRYRSKPRVDVRISATCEFNHGSWLQITQVWRYIRERIVRGRSGNYVNRKRMLVLNREGTGIVSGKVHSKTVCRRHDCVFSV